MVGSKLILILIGNGDFVDKFQALIQLKDPTSAAQAKAVSLIFRTNE